jgi:hypothetical protein
MAGVPALLIKENMGGNYRHINPQTGLIVPDARLEQALAWFREHYATLRPRAWAMANIAPAISTRRLQEFLREAEISAGRPWTEGLLVKVNDPELRYQDRSHEGLLLRRQELLQSLCKGSSDARLAALVASMRAGHDPAIL